MLNTNALGAGVHALPWSPGQRGQDPRPSAVTAASHEVRALEAGAGMRFLKLYQDRPRVVCILLSVHFAHGLLVEAL